MLSVISNTDLPVPMALVCDEAGVALALVCNPRLCDQLSDDAVAFMRDDLLGRTSG